MKTLVLFLVALLALCMTPSGSALRCGECSSPPWYPGAPPCEKSKIEIRTCPQYWDRCFTVNLTLKDETVGSLSMEIKNCTSSIGCDPNSQYYVCKYANATGMLSSCSLSCCSGDECNIPKEDQSSTQEEQPGVPNEEQISTQEKPSSPLNFGKDEGSFLRCGECSSPPWYPGAPPCEKSKIGIRTCPQYWDRCFTATATFKDERLGLQSIEIKNCTSSFGCDQNSKYYVCNYMNITGALSSCSVSCCPEDGCNLPKEDQTSTKRVHSLE